jgi:DNA primase
MAFPPSFLDELRSRISLGGLVGRRVRLQRKGRELAGLCPFHHEKTPSFYVVEDKAFFHCFGCGAHGSAIDFVMRADNLDFLEAIERLALEAGIAVPQASPQERERVQRQKTLLEALDAAARFYEAQLWGRDGAPGRDYLCARGLDEATIRRFRLGFATADRHALERGLRGEFPEPLLVEAGLVRRPESGGAYDYFHNRIMFPSHRLWRAGDRRRAAQILELARGTAFRKRSRALWLVGGPSQCASGEHGARDRHGREWRTRR